MRKKLLPLFLTCVGMAALLASCGPNSDGSDSVIKHQVKFFEDSQLTIQYGETVEVESGSTVAKPAVDPTKAEDDSATYTFKEWVDYDTLDVYDFSKPVTKNLNLYAEFETHTKEAPLYVYLWQGDADLFITDAEAEAIESKVKELTPNSIIRTVKGESINQFCVEVNNFGKADVVIGGATLNPTDPSKYPDRTAFIESIPLSSSESEGKLTKVAAGWFASENRYVGICNSSQNTHYTEASKLYTALTNEGPYTCTLSQTSVTLCMGETATLTADVKDGVELVWGSEDPNIATIEDGVITPVAIGTTNVYALVGPVKYPVSVSVIAERKPYTINVAMYARVYANVETLKAEYAKVADDLCSVNWITNEYEKVATFSEAVDNYAKTNEVTIDLVVAHTQVTSGHENGLANAATYGYEFSSRANIDSTWSTKGDTNYYAGTNALTTGQAETECAKIANILKEANPDYFTLAETSASVLVGQTVQINANGANVTYESKDTAVATVNETGLVTGVAAGSTIIEVTLGHAVKEFTITVNEDTTPNNDLLVWINIRPDQNWISEADRADIETQLKALDSTKTITLVTRPETKVAEVKAAQEAQGLKDRVDLIIARDALNNQYDGIERASLDASWGFSSGYVYIMSDVINEHKTLVSAAVTMLSSPKDQAVYGDDYFTLAAYSGSVKVGETITIEASKTVTFVSNDTAVAIVNENGVVTGVADGSATITCTLNKYSVLFSVTVTAGESQSYSMVVYLMSHEAAYLDQIQAEYAKVADKDCLVTWVSSTQTKYAAFSTEINEYATTNDVVVDLIVGHSNTFNTSKVDSLPGAYGYSFSSTTQILSDWTQGTDTAHKAGINALTTDTKVIGECNKIVTILTTPKAA